MFWRNLVARWLRSAEVVKHARKVLYHFLIFLRRHIGCFALYPSSMAQRGLYGSCCCSSWTLMAIMRDELVGLVMMNSGRGRRK